VKKSFNIQELFALLSPNVMEPSLCNPTHQRAFQRHQEHDLKHPGLVDLIATKQTNYLPS